LTTVATAAAAPWRGQTEAHDAGFAHAAPCFCAATAPAVFIAVVLEPTGHEDRLQRAASTHAAAATAWVAVRDFAFATCCVANAVERVTLVAHELLDSLVTTSPPRDRETEAAKAKARAAARFG